MKIRITESQLKKIKSHLTEDSENPVDDYIKVLNRCINEINNLYNKLIFITADDIIRDERVLKPFEDKSLQLEEIERKYRKIAESYIEKLPEEEFDQLDSKISNANHVFTRKTLVFSYIFSGLDNARRNIYDDFENLDISLDKNYPFSDVKPIDITQQQF